MGYDYYARQPGSPRPEITEYTDAEYAALRAWLDDKRNYLRRNIWGGSAMAEAMVKLGMGYMVSEHVPIPEFPDVEDFGCTWDDDGEPVGERADEYRKAIDEHLSWHGVSDIPGIPVHKIAGSNDGWHVTALECQAALGIYRQRIAEGAEHPEIFGDDVIPFLEHCAATDGFVTH